MNATGQQLELRCTETVNVDGRVDEKNDVRYIGQAWRHWDGTWRALADVGGALCVVEVRITFLPEDA